ncbi:hypothetical protein ACI2OX_09240 [Bacillus sp. N9]
MIVWFEKYKTIGIVAIVIILAVILFFFNLMIRRINRFKRV